MDPDQLRTLAAVVDEGSLDAAARVLHVTPSAVSQRLKALEASVGQVVVVRSSPAEPTDAGRVLLRLARQREVLEQEAWAELRGGTEDHARVPLTVAVNADSLATWFGGVVAEVARWDDVTLRLRVTDEGWTRDLLRSGEVVAAVTADPAPVGGCRSAPLGTMRYVAVATPALRERYASGRGVDWAAMPVVHFDARDAMQDRYLALRGATSGPVHEIPSSDAYADAVRAGLGWAMLPEAQHGDTLESGRLVRLGRQHLDVVLHWQAWSMDSRALGRLGEAVRAVAQRTLRPVPGAPQD